VCSVYLENFTGVTNKKLTIVINDIAAEEDIVIFRNTIEAFSSLVSEECSAAVMPFICQYVYPPCDDNGSQLKNNVLIFVMMYVLMSGRLLQLQI